MTNFTWFCSVTKAGDSAEQHANLSNMKLILRKVSIESYFIKLCIKYILNSHVD